MRRFVVIVMIAALAGACGGSKKAATAPGAKKAAPEEKMGDGAKSMDDADKPEGGAGAPAPVETKSDPCAGGEHH